MICHPAINDDFGAILRSALGLQLNRSRNAQFFVILRAERCTHGQAAPNSLFALEEHPCSISLACIVRRHPYAGVISVNLLQPYVKSRDYGMCGHILLCCDSDYFFLTRGWQRSDASCSARYYCYQKSMAKARK